MKNNKPLVQCIHVEYCSDPHCYHYHPHKRDFKNLGCGRVRKCRQGRAISCWVVKDNTRLNELKNLIHKVRSKHFRLKMEYEDSIVIRLQEQIDQEEINKESIKKFGNFDMVIFDEIHKLKNWKAQQSKISLLLSKKIKSTIGLTGTPVGNNLLDLFNEMKVIDLGKTFGNSFWSYRKEYFDEKYGWFASEWIPKKDTEEKIVEKLKAVVIRYDKDECLDLPPQVYETRSIEMTDEQRKYIEKFQSDLDVYLQGKKVTTVNALAKAMKISQVTSGFMKVDGKEIYFDKNPKLDELLEIVEEINEKIIIFHRFVGEGRLIQKALSKKYKVCCLRGEIKNKQEQLLSFQNDEKVKAMIAYPDSGGIGIDLFQASITIFFSNEYSYIKRHQCEGRTHRTGQVNKCLYIDLIAENTIDEVVYETLMGKKNLSDRILNKLKGE